MTALLVLWTVFCLLSVIGSQVTRSVGWTVFWSIALVVHIVVLIGVLT